MLALALLALQYIDPPIAGCAPEEAAREAAIWAELRSEPTPDWAGAYTDNLMLSPRAGFVQSTSSCMGPSLTHGDLIVSGREIRFVYANWGWPREEVWWSIPWGERRFLIREDLIPEFCMIVNSGLELRGADDWPKMRIGDAGRPVSGLPQVPARFEHLLLCEPIDTEVLRVTRAMPFEEVWKEAPARVWLRSGTRSGVQVGHCFHFAKSWSRPMRGYVTEVDETFCIVELTGNELWHAGGIGVGDRTSTSPQRLARPVYPHLPPISRGVNGGCSLDPRR